MALPTVKWTKITNTLGTSPKPRHSHSAVAFEDLIITFGGASEEFSQGLHVFNTTKNEWFIPTVRGDIPSGYSTRASSGVVCDGSRIVMFAGQLGGAQDCKDGYYDDLYELQPSNWEWMRLRPKATENNALPCPRFGHSFTLCGTKAYLFGGCANEPGCDFYKPREIDDLFALELTPDPSDMVWEEPATKGQSPPASADHSCVAHQDKDGRRPRLIFFGGKDSRWLNGLWQLDIETMTWSEPVAHGVCPRPRFQHSATVINSRMFVFGGWEPEVDDKLKMVKCKCLRQWPCTNTLASLNLDTMTWEPVATREIEVANPRGRAGHCAAAIDTRLYIWSGRDEWRRVEDKQVCFKDLWSLETETPPAPPKIRQVFTGPKKMRLCWDKVSRAEAYLVQVQVCDVDPTEATTPTEAPATPAIQAATPALSAPDV